MPCPPPTCELEISCQASCGTTERANNVQIFPRRAVRRLTRQVLTCEKKGCSQYSKFLISGTFSCTASTGYETAKGIDLFSSSQAGATSRQRDEKHVLGGEASDRRERKSVARARVFATFQRAYVCDGDDDDDAPQTIKREEGSYANESRTSKHVRLVTWAVKIPMSFSSPPFLTGHFPLPFVAYSPRDSLRLW